MLDFDSIKTLSDFLSWMDRVDIDRKAKGMYKRIFDKGREFTAINATGWEITIGWLRRNIYLPNKNPLEYLMKGYKAVKIEHERNQALSWDQWNENRFQEFERWVKFRVEMHLLEVKTSDKKATSIPKT